ncbi:hypothetical protein R1sor_010446 [Riccia sorocarpa]|uniref:RanBD1 domain-containing protein n=1 Tax=Riccia sorocarpa TaxID=122646 RepID=A0ABD3I1M9_9MARC
MAGEPFDAEEKKEEATVSQLAATSTIEGETHHAAPSATTGEEGAEEKTGGEEEDTGAQVAPIIRLEEVAISTGEENEDVLLDSKAKLYRFDKDGNQWKERGVGQVKLLQHKETGKIRLLMRQSRTLKICANHLVLPATTLQEHAGSDKTWVWHASDYSDGELKEELFCIRFGSIESAQKFKTAFEEAQDKMRGKEESADEEADSAATALGGLSVEEKTTKEATEKPATEAQA